MRKILQPTNNCDETEDWEMESRRKILKHNELVANIYLWIRKKTKCIRHFQQGFFFFFGTNKKGKWSTSIWTESESGAWKPALARIHSLRVAHTLHLLLLNNWTQIRLLIKDDSWEHPWWLLYQQSNVLADYTQSFLNAHEQSCLVLFPYWFSLKCGQKYVKQWQKKTKKI